MDYSCTEHCIDFTLFIYLSSVKGYVHIDTCYLYINQILVTLNIMIALSYIHYLINDDLSNNAHIKPFSTISHV